MQYCLGKENLDKLDKVNKVLALIKSLIYARKKDAHGGAIKD